MIKLIKFSSSAVNWFEEAKRSNPDVLKTLREQVPQLNIDADVQMFSPWLHYEKVIAVTDEDLEYLTRVGVPCEVKSLRTLKLTTPSAGPAGFQYHVHVPSFGMLSITKVIVLEDCCTLELQDYLNEGWRILCVCPPLDKRRPDYVLGRAKAENEI